MAMLSYLHAFAAVLSISTVLCAVPSSTNVVDVGYARYQGFFNRTSNITSFRGIRYAAPPTYSLRWKLPQKPPKSLGILQANTEASRCYQGSAGAGFPVTTTSFVDQDEDCLFLNVFVPGNVSAKTSLPVVVWFHGGGYIADDVAGNSAGDGGDFIRDADGGVISVIVQYRLGIFGFLAGSEIKANGALNAGLLDQRFALQWVQDHIASFGGDPSKVAIWGQSAGAGSVLQHVVANGGKTAVPLFRAAITSSTFLPSQYHYNDPIPEARGLYAQAVNMTNCGESQEKLSCLRAADPSTLAVINNQTSFDAFSGTLVFVPVVDGEYIVERPVETLKKGSVNGDVLLAVTNSFEGRIVVNESLTSNLHTYVANVFPNFDQVQVDATVAQYTNVGLETTFDQAIAIMGESIFICPSYFLMEAFGTRGYKGEFAIPPANHEDDVGEYFPSTFPAITANQTLIHSFAQSFLAVAMSLDPNAKFDPADVTPKWHPWNQNATEMLFNTTESDQAVIHPITTYPGLLERCNFWQNISSSTPQ